MRLETLDRTSACAVPNHAPGSGRVKGARGIFLSAAQADIVTSGYEGLLDNGIMAFSYRECRDCALWRIRIAYSSKR